MSLISVKRLALPSFLLIGFGVFFASSAYDLISWHYLSQHYGGIKNFVADQQWLSYLGFFCAYVATVAFSLPIASLLTLAGGAVFGWPATILVLGAATTGAGLVFFATRNLFTDMLRRRAGPFLSKLEDGFSKNGFFYLLALRLIPAAPFWAVNIVPALTRMSLSQFLVATFLGIIPGTCTYIWFGRSFDHVLAAGKRPDIEALTNPNVLLPLAGLAALALIPIFVRRHKTNSEKKGNSEPDCFPPNQG